MFLKDYHVSLLSLCYRVKQSSYAKYNNYLTQFLSGNFIKTLLFCIIGQCYFSNIFLINFIVWPRGISPFHITWLVHVPLKFFIKSHCFNFFLVLSKIFRKIMAGCFILTLSFIMLKNNQTYFKNVFTPQNF